MEPKNRVGRLADMDSEDTRQGYVDTDSPGPIKPETGEVVMSGDVNDDTEVRMNERAVQNPLGNRSIQGQRPYDVRGTGAQDPSLPASPSARAELGKGPPSLHAVGHQAKTRRFCY